MEHMVQSSSVKGFIVNAVADCENSAPGDQPLLAEKLDTETYEKLISYKSELNELLTFEYLFYDVTILPDGEVIVTP